MASGRGAPASSSSGGHESSPAGTPETGAGRDDRPDGQGAMACQASSPPGPLAMSIGCSSAMLRPCPDPADRAMRIDLPTTSGEYTQTPSGDHWAGPQLDVPAASGWSPQLPDPYDGKSETGRAFPASRSVTLMTCEWSLHHAIRSPAGDHVGQKPVPTTVSVDVPMSNIFTYAPATYTRRVVAGSDDQLASTISGLIGEVASRRSPLPSGWMTFKAR